jgi:L-fuconolactonase
MIDAHIHLWRFDRRESPWPGADLPALCRDFLLDDLRADLASAGVTGIVLVQSEPFEADTEWLSKLADDPIVSGVVGWTELAATDAPAAIDRLADTGRLLAIRPMVQRLAADWYDDPALDPALAHLAQRGLVLEALVRPCHLPALARLIARHPTLAIVIDHAAKPAIGGDTAAWANDMRVLAAYPQVACKISGLPTEIVDGQPDETMHGVIDDLLAMFGPDRLIWGSDWPVVTLRKSYGEWLAFAQDAIPAEHHAAVFGGNAARIYRLPTTVEAA